MNRTPVVLSVALLAMSSISGCATDEPKTLRADVLDVQAADTLILDFDGDERRVRVAGIRVPEPDDCVGNEALDTMDGLVGGSTRLEVVDQGVDDAGTQLVSIDYLANKDLAAEMVAQGVAVADALEKDLTPAMAQAREEAKRSHRGFFAEQEDCTYAGLHADAVQALREALGQPTPADSDDAAHAISVLVAAIAGAKSVEEFAERAQRDLRLLAYPSTRLTKMATKLRYRRVSARISLRETRVLRAKLKDAERLERIRQEELERARQEELERIRREQAQSDESSHSDDSGGAYPGYTGPRCYEPGGKVWHPC